MAGKINKSLIQKQIFETKSVQRLVKKIVEEEVNKQKALLIQDFNSHPVTKEISAGPDGKNQSGTLGGYGNLFSFIGFNTSSRPVDPVQSLLNKIYVENTVRIKKDGFEFKVNVPSEDELSAVTKMPWESGRSWLFDMEKTISGLGSYLYGRFKQSRSSAGIQSENLANSRRFKSVKYFGTMYKRFFKNLGIK